jgi:hypothetical protein
MCVAYIPSPSEPIEPLNGQKKKVASDRNGSMKVHAKDSAFIKSKGIREDNSRGLVVAAQYLGTYLLHN